MHLRSRYQNSVIRDTPRTSFNSLLNNRAVSRNCRYGISPATPTWTIGTSSLLNSVICGASRTSGGKSVARLTPSRISSLMSSLLSASTSIVTVMMEMFSIEYEVISSMPEIPSISSSILLVTLSSTSFGDAPG